MTLSVSIFKNGVKLGTGQIVAQASSFVKNLIVARFVSPQDFGIAAIFAMTFSLLEMMSNLSAQTLLVQAEYGDDPRFQRTVHLIQACRGLINATLIFLVAGPVSHLFSAPEAKPAFECLALIPLIRAFNHVDINRMQREMRFGPSIIVDAGSNVLVALLALPMAYWLRNYWTMLWLLVAQSAFCAIGSHLLAERTYGWARDRIYSRRIFEFGWPLLLNGVLLYGILEGDRFVIGSAHRLFSNASYTLADLGAYSVAFALTQAPAVILANVSSSLFLPLLSRSQALPRQFERRYLACAQIVSLLAAVVAIGFIITGGKVVVLVYGQKYAAAAAYIGWLSVMWAVRTLRYAPIVAAMAFGDTRNTLISNVARASALAGIVLVAATGRSLTWIPVCGFLGELLALAVSIGRLWRCQGIPVMLSLKPYAAFLAGVGISALAAAGGIGRLGLAATFLLAASLVAMQVVGMIYVSSGVREEVGALVLKVWPSKAEKAPT